jgi:hypothetical protein
VTIVFEDLGKPVGIILPWGEMKRRALCDALDKCGGNHLLAARRLGLGKTTIYRMAKLYNYQSPTVQGGSATFYTDALGDTTIGTRSAAVPLSDGKAVKVSPRWFEDFGSGQLASGGVRVDLDPAFAQTVDTSSYHVFVTPKGENNGLYVTNETTESFEVRESNGGHSTVEFDYRIVAHRKCYEHLRMPGAEIRRPAPGLDENTAAQ